MEQKRGLFHLLAVFAVIIWGSTFISTKLLLNNGISPRDIFFYRTLIAYLGIWLVCPRKLLTDSWKDEAWMVLAGITGGSAFFVLQNTALGITQAANVSFIVCTAPLLTVLLSLAYYRTEHAHKGLIFGSILALIGVGLVVFSGSVELKLSPLGDLLTLSSAMLWAVYSIIIKEMGTRYSMLLITRKVFFYGAVTLIPLFLFEPLVWDAEAMSRPVVWGNLLFMAVFASLICFVAWSYVLKRLGTVVSSNYLYLNPLVTMITSYLLLGEQITLTSLVGLGCITLGVYLSQGGKVRFPRIRY